MIGARFGMLSAVVAWRAVLVPTILTAQGTWPSGLVCARRWGGESRIFCPDMRRGTPASGLRSCSRVLLACLHSRSGSTSTPFTRQDASFMLFRHLHSFECLLRACCPQWRHYSSQRTGGGQKRDRRADRDVVRRGCDDLVTRHRGGISSIRGGRSASHRLRCGYPEAGALLACFDASTLRPPKRARS